ncbi:MAG: Stp1/IreP family PP2C-type Ser/Thr phosphatase [Burkholderiaceae bacterium]
MLYAYCALSDVGCVRANNEDAVRVDEGRGIALLADGMGGYNAGEVASAMAVEHIGNALGAWLDSAGAGATAPAVLDAMEDSTDRANRLIFEAANTQPECAGMGTTVVLAVLREDQVLVGHAGDSRAYRWRDGALVQLTRDHSLLQEQLDAGLITPQQAAVSGYRSWVTRALGVEDTVLLETGSHALHAGDTLLLCSDGLTEMVSDSAIAAILAEAAPLPTRAQRLIDAAKAAGGRDNVSVILIHADQTIKKSGIVGKWWKK